MLRHLIFIFTLAFAPAALAADVTVDMLTKAPDSNERNIYAPDLIRVDVGDTVTWLSTDKGHNVEFIRGAVPEGVDIFRSRISQDASFTFTVPGVYAYKCTPHYGLGMVGVVIVGDDTSNLAEIADKRFPGKSKERMADILSRIE